MNKIKTNALGIILCLAISFPACYLGKLYPLIGGPVFAIIIGMIITHFFKDKSKIQSGVTYTSKKILQYAVILLGFGMNLKDILKIGSSSLPIIISTITVSLVVAYVLYRILKIPSKTATLIGVGSSICGGSAIAATAPVIEADDEEIAQAISVIFLFNILAALVFPTLGGILGLSNDGFGLFAGSAVNDTSSVTATATAWDGIHGSNTLDQATIVKLTRTLAIIPITLFLAFKRTRDKEKSNSKVNLKKIFPYFILFFVLASIITTVFNLPNTTTAPIKELSKFFIIMAMGAIGLNTNIVKLVKSGGKPILLGVSCWVAITGVCLLMQVLLGLF